MMVWRSVNVIWSFDSIDKLRLTFCNMPKSTLIRSIRVFHLPFTCWQFQFIMINCVLHFSHLLLLSLIWFYFFFFFYCISQPYKMIFSVFFSHYFCYFFFNFIWHPTHVRSHFNLSLPDKAKVFATNWISFKIEKKINGKSDRRLNVCFVYFLHLIC